MPSLHSGWKHKRIDKRVENLWKEIEKKRKLNDWELYQKEWNFVETEYNHEPSNNGLDFLNPAFAFDKKLTRWVMSRHKEKINCRNRKAFIMTDTLEKTWTDIHNPITNDIHNSTLTLDENHYISYLHKNWNPGWVASDNPDIGETALVTEEPWTCLILNGDFRKEYEEVVDGGYDACYKFYESKKAEHGSSWSN